MSSTIVAKIDEALGIARGNLLRVQCKKKREHDFPSSGFVPTDDYLGCRNVGQSAKTTKQRQ